MFNNNRDHNDHNRRHPTRLTHWTRPKVHPVVQGEPVGRIYLIRHGETNENRMGIIQGQLDTVLNEVGVEQAQLCGNRLKDVPFAAAFSSDLQRASKTAEIILSYQPEATRVQLKKDEGLRERAMGALQGVQFGAYDKTKVYEGEEMGKEFSARVMSWWQLQVERFLASVPQGRRPAHVLAVTHGAYISMLVRVLLSDRHIFLPRDERLDQRYYNTSITIIDMFSNGKGILVRQSDVTHLLTPKTPAAAVPGESAKNADAEVAT